MFTFDHGKNNELHGLKSKPPQNCPHLFVGCISASPAAWSVRSALPVCLLTRVFWDPDDVPDDDLDDDPDHPAGSAPGTGGPGGVGDSIHPQGSRCMSPLARRLGLSSLDSPHCSNASAGLTLQHCSTAAVLARWHQQQLCKFSCRRPGEPIARERRGTKLDVNTKYILLSETNSRSDQDWKLYDFVLTFLMRPQSNWSESLSRWSGEAEISAWTAA